MPIRLLALDSDDLAVVSAHLQDARLIAGDIAFFPSERRLALVATKGEGAGTPFGLRIDRVIRAERLNLPADRSGTPLVVVGALFEPGEAPGGRILLLFGEGRSLRLTVECVEVALGELAGGGAPARPEGG